MTSRALPAYVTAVHVPSGATRRLEVDARDSRGQTLIAAWPQHTGLRFDIRTGYADARDAGPGWRLTEDSRLELGLPPFDAPRPSAERARPGPRPLSPDGAETRTLALFPRRGA